MFDERPEGFVVVAKREFEIFAILLHRFRITQALHREIRVAISTALPPLFRGVSDFFATIDASPALRARLRLAMEKTEATLAAAIMQDMRSKPSYPTPQVIAAMVMAIEHMLLERLRAHLFERDGVAISRRSLLHACDMASS